MPRTLMAQTNEVDEADIAIVDIMAQLDLDNNLMKNSVGLIFGDTNLFDPELLPALAEKLPFDLVGINSNMTAGPYQKGDFSYLTLMVLTSDEVNMTTGLSAEFDRAPLDSIKDLHAELAGKLNGKPKLTLAFGSRQSSRFHPDRLLRRLNEVTGDCPIFGSLASDLDSIVEKGYLVYNGQRYMDRLALIMLDGPIKPKFSLYKIPENKFLKRKAIITSCEGNIIKEINGLPALKYLTTLGLVVDDNEDFTFNIPLVVEYPEAGYWEPILILKQPGLNHLICTQDVEENSTLGLAGLDDTDVIKAAGDLADELKWEHFNFCLIHSCQGRHISLGLDYLAEIERVRASLSNSLPYSLSYSGGEICPRLEDKKGPINGFHSISLTCCRF
jgi:hypothetical protein